MRGKITALAAYGVLLVSLIFSLGYLLGLGKGETQVQVTAQTVQQPEEAAVQNTEAEPQEPQPQTPTEQTPLDLNTATQAELELLPGIGPGLAARIVAYRQENGKFVAKEQIMDVEGIGEKRYAEIEAMITIGGT